MTRYERLEYDVLTTAGIPSLPKPVDMKSCGFWKRAIVKVATRGLDESFAIVRNEESRIIYEKVFGTGGISCIKEFMPFEWYSTELPAGIGTKDDLRKFISDEYGVDYSEVKDLSEEKLEKLYKKYVAAKEKAKRNAAKASAGKSNDKGPKE